MSAATVTVGELIAALSAHDPSLPVIHFGEGYIELDGTLTPIRVVPVSSCYKAYDEAGEYERRNGVNCHTPTGPAFDALFLA